MDTFVKAEYIEGLFKSKLIFLFNETNIKKLPE